MIPLSIYHPRLYRLYSWHQQHASSLCKALSYQGIFISLVILMTQTLELESLLLDLIQPLLKDQRVWSLNSSGMFIYKFLFRFPTVFLKREKILAAKTLEFKL